MNKKYKVAIVGATGLVGRTILKVLEEKNFSNVEYTLFASKKSAGKKIEFLGTNYIICELNETSFDIGFDYAIFSAGASTSVKYAPIAVSNGCIVIDNSSAFRMNPKVPLVVPEVNKDKIFENNGIIANPNCSTIQAMLPLKVLDDKYKVKRGDSLEAISVKYYGKASPENTLKLQNANNLTSPHSIYEGQTLLIPMK